MAKAISLLGGVSLLLFLFLPSSLAQADDGQVYGFISFAVPMLTTSEENAADSEFTTVLVPLVREVGTTGQVLVTVEVTNSTASDDFLSPNVVVIFDDGATTSNAVFSLLNDNLPEGNETFLLEITFARLGAEIGAQNTMTLVITANDEPHGQLGFSQSSVLSAVAEPTEGSATVDVTVTRGPGIFGRVTADFEVVDGPNLGVDDMSPTQGQLVFPNEVNSQTITFSVFLDEIPENNETFTLRLSNPKGGATLVDGSTDAEITILENDTPIRFTQAVTEVSEDAATVEVVVTRGLLENGDRVGDFQVQATVQYTTQDSTATAGIDYVSQSGTITFLPGETSQSITVSLINDDTPEGDEFFTIILSNLSSGNVLYPPSTATVVIDVNDNAGGLVQFASTEPVLVGEDDGGIARFTIRRTVGNFSDLIVAWQVTESGSGELATDDFQPPSGNVTIPDGASEAVLEIRPFNDAAPEVAEVFMVQLVGVVSGEGELNEQGVRITTLIVADSDDVYGLVEWVDDENLLEVTSTTPRELHLAINRSGSSIGIIAVDYGITYLPVGVSDPALGDSSPLEMARGSVQLVGGQMLAEFTVAISDDAFLEPRANFYAYINSTSLIGGVSLVATPTVSPQIGSRSEVLVTVPATAANGYIGFSPEFFQVSVSEPDSGLAITQLDVVRTGAYGQADVTWQISLLPGTSASDIGPTSGVASIADGTTSTTIDVIVLADDEPEVDEFIRVQLISVSPSNQMILSDQDESTVTIVENDDAAGVFFINETTLGPFTIQESLFQVLRVIIQREGGALTSELLQFTVLPSASDFIGGSGIVAFQPGQRQSIITFLAQDDSIPENNESFFLTISAIGGDMDIVREPSSVNITILANDDYAGVFSFATTSLALSVDEPSNNDSEVVSPSTLATFTIERGAGSFTLVTVDWQVTTGGGGADIAPTSGTVEFSEGQQTGTFEIQALTDELPEQAESFTVALTSVSGDARIASDLFTATLTVSQNDDPINFNGSSAEVEEGQTAVFSVIRGGQANGIAEVSFTLAYSSASPSDVIISPEGGVLVFQDGQAEAEISVSVVDDEIPEESETLQIELVSTTGDAVIVSPRVATLMIQPSDDPNGVFGFAEGSREVVLQEGDTRLLYIERQMGLFGTVVLRWTVYQVNTTTGQRYPDSPSDISPATNLVTFFEGNTSVPVAITVVNDAQPELEEVFEIELEVATVTGDSEDGGRLGNFSVSRVVVAESDDPYGLFRFDEDSMMVELAEDAGAVDTTVRFGVERTFGTLGQVQVTWEILPQLEEPLPPFTDTLFLGSREPGVSPVQSRNGTGTVALQFPGSSLVMVPVQYQPDVITDEFTISLWLQPTAGTSGVLVAKATGSTRFYSLSLVADVNSFILRLSYLPASQQAGFSSVEASLPESSLLDGLWHSIAVSVGSGTALFYSDGSLIASRALLEDSIGDGDGVVTVGGLSDGEFYVGTLQDVRIYTTMLTASQVAAIGIDSASSEVTPISGYLTFLSEETRGEITVSSLDDDIPEPSRFYTLQLTSSNGGSRIERGEDVAYISLLKSDAGNGVFGFDPLSLSTLISEPGSMSLVVNRDRGTFGTVAIYWEVREGDVAGSLASDDFLSASGYLEFPPESIQQNLTLITVNELIPELSEYFVVVLLSLEASDNLTSSTPSSGASINDTLALADVAIIENDYPYGLLQFATSPPLLGEAIVPAISVPEVFAMETDGSVTVYIVRAQGNLGTVSAEYITVDDSASSVGVNPDYVPSASTVTFGPDDQVQSLTLTLLDDSLPELGKVFYVDLTNPDGSIGDPGLDIGSRIAINILPSDDAFGVFAFSPASLSVVVAEGGDSGGSLVSLTVTRSGGTFGDILVYWEVEGGVEVEEDISPRDGVVELAEGQSEGVIVVTIIDEMDPELLEIFNIRLLNVTGGAILSSAGDTVATVTIQANDYPYGLFVFSSSFRPLVVGEWEGEVEVRVSREFGTVGEVTVEFQTIISDEVASSSALAGINVEQLIANSQIAITGSDYLPNSGLLVFAEGETSQSFNITVLQDSLPELNEYIFLSLTGVQLTGSPADPSVLPVIPAGNESLAFVVVEENDDARGVISFVNSVYNTAEPSQDFLLLSRAAGTFGMVSVQWQATPTTADTFDFTPSSGTVVFSPGLNSTIIPLSIPDDLEPEFQESLTVSLVGVDGGARIDDGGQSAVVNILANDDPNGALEFASDSQMVAVQEPEGSTPATVTLTVQRTGGSVGVIEATWTVSSSDGLDASLDIAPLSGTALFVSGNTEQSIVLSVLPDTIPEITESFTVQLVGTVGGARIGEDSVAIVQVLPNDNPYGIVSLASSTFVALEADNDTISMVPVTRSLGTFGDLLVTYSVQPADIATLATADGTLILEFFSSPLPDTALPSSALLSEPVVSPSVPGGVLNECARLCLSNEACLSFSSDGVAFCQLYLSLLVTEGTTAQAGAGYYEKDQDMVQPFAQAVASAGTDFRTAFSATITVPEGSGEAAVPITIIGDTIPELNESLIVTLSSVEVVGGTIEDSATEPLLGAITETTVVILESDDPHGRFYLFAGSGDSELQVPEVDSLGVTLTIERRGGTIGDVQISWAVVSGIAVEGEDYGGSGAVLSFPAGSTRSSFAISILDDTTPERDEDLLIALIAPTGGAVVASGDGGTTLVVIEANDNAAGVVGLATFSRSVVVTEGETALVTVERLIGSLGVVQINWEITGPGNIADEFFNTTGYAIFEEGSNSTDIVIQVRADATPEVSEPYTLNITSIETLSSDISPSGHATLNPLGAMATITIQASDNPHGVVEFQAASVTVTSGESLPVELTIVRQFGTIGAIEVHYVATSGSLNPGSTLATPGEDFDPQNMTIVLGDGQQSTVIAAPVVDDSEPELAEVFLVQLLSVNLLGSSEGDATIPPSIGGASTAQVTIEPNDSPQGELTFTTDILTVPETIGQVVIDIAREQGTEGEVSVVYLVTAEGATNQRDFIAMTIDMLVFPPGQLSVSLTITIVNDNEPEIDESFCIGLSLPEGGAILGRINRTCVIITANDDAYGVFSFDPASLFRSLMEAEETATSENVAELVVARQGGVFGQVTVPFEVETAGREDLSPAMGALVFNENEASKILTLEAVRDAIAELDERYTVSLLPPLDVGRLETTNTTATIAILANQDPFGVLEIFPVGSNMSSVLVEEDVAHTVFEVRRSFGTLSEISATVVTVQDSAVSPEGNNLALSTLQLLETVSAQRWYQFTSGTDQEYLVLASSSQVVLYAWRGVFTPVQILPVSGVSSFAFLSVGGQDLLVAANGGSPGNREVNSSVYQFNNEGQLQLVQYILTTGASDVVAFQSPTSGAGEWYLVFSSREDSEGNPNVNSPVLKWNGAEFQQAQMLATIGASAMDVFSISDTVYLAVASQTDSRSSVFVWSSGETFRLHQNFDSEEAADVEFIDLGGISYLAVASRTTGVDLLLWSEIDQFTPNQTLAVDVPIRVETANDLLVVTSDGAPGRVFDFQDNSQPTELQSLYLPVSTHLYPFALGSERTFIAQAITSSSSQPEQSLVSELIFTNTSMADYYQKNFTLTFAIGESSHEFAVEIIDDVIPEVGESFSVQLEGPLEGGARLGEQQSARVTILTNDDAHGLIGFAPSSLSVITQELDFGVPVVLEVVRNGGAFGEVRVEWEVTGQHNEGEVTPTSGTVIFPDGVSTSTINLLIVADVDPELNEVTEVSLSTITENGVPPGGDTARGARLIPSQILSVITVQANDAPHGVVVWSPPVVVAIENEGVDNTVELTLIREFGSIGAILISYSTEMASSFPVDEQAVQGQDFVPSSGTVVMGDGEISASILITILQDDMPELVETFLVTITEVQLVDEAVRGNSTSNSPRTEAGQESVQVQILENDNTRGVISFAESAVSVEENAGFVSLQVVRSGGTFGEVGVDFVTSGATAIGGGVDFSTDSGTVRLPMNVREAEIIVNVTNDLEPELEETFTVTLTTPLMGAQLGSLTTVTVTILRNDDINGVFSFADNSLLFLIPESQGPSDPLGMATLVVQRESNFVGTVTVYWEVNEDGRADLEPVSGNLTFAEDDTEKSFQVRAIGDGIPELFESYVVQLVAIDGGGRIVGPDEARIAIQASDDPSGVIGFEDYPQGIIIDEGDELIFKMVRTAGLGGTVSATWAITPGDITVFVSTSDTVFFTDGQAEATITVQTLSDAIPEVARLLSLQITSTNLARVDLNSSQVDIVVAASNNPHGLVQFAPPLVLEIQETSTVLSLPLQRTQGLVGSLQVNFSIIQSSAMTPEDFTVLNQTAIIPGDTASADILVQINNDETPELEEAFSITLDSVELAEDINGGRDFDFAGDAILIDQPPLIGTTNELEVRILENDNPYGIITLSDSTYRVNEGELVIITLVRTGGTFGAAFIDYSFQVGSADDSDFSSIGGMVLFSVGESMAEIGVQIFDDFKPELQEDFTITISLSQPSTTEAQLGAITMATIIIESSDSPFGMVGFSEDDVGGFVLDNPTVDEGPVFLTLTVNRINGTFNTTQVTWVVVGPNPGREGEDIDQTTVQGTLFLNEGQAFGVIEITILPSLGVEPEESFTVTLTDASNNVEIATDLRSVSITILQRGMPYGVIGFIGDALEPRFVSEPENFSLPLVRTSEVFGIVQVVFEVTGLGDPQEDVSPVSGSVTFLDGQYEANVMLQVLQDLEPELEETYTVTLTEALGGATLSEQATVSTFIIRSNDAPYGRFAISSPLISVSSSIAINTRTLSFTITRELGSMGTVFVEASVSYDPNPTGDYFVETVPVQYTFADSETETSFSLTIIDGVFLSPGSTFTISITQATLTPQGTSAEISSTSGSVPILVTEEVSNPLIGFDQASLEATVNDGAAGNNVALTIMKRGQLGVVLVSWATGLPGGSLVNGSITPSSGSILMEPEESDVTIELTVTPRAPHGIPEVFVVRLFVASATSSLPAQVDPGSSTATIEPQGVLQLGGDTFSAVEGTQVTLTVWRRYGSMGDIVVTGIAMVAPSNSIPSNQIAAQGGVDFSIVPVSITLGDGETVGEIVVPLPMDNEVSGPPKVFHFTLSEVQREALPPQGTPTSPRLSSDNITALVNIIDDETVFSLILPPSTSSSINEGDSITVMVTRSGWLRGSVSLSLRTVNGTADANEDYVPVSMEITLAENETSRTLEIRTVTDDIAELAEYFTVILENPLGGLAYVNPSASSIDVTISANDNPSGIFSLVPAFLSLTEDETPSGTISIRRSPGLLGEVTLTWEVVPAIETFVVEMDTVTFGPGDTAVDISLQLQSNVDSGEFLLRISSDAEGIDFGIQEATITVVGKRSAIFQISEQNRTIVATGDTVTLVVERVDGDRLSAQVTYSTSQPTTNELPVEIGELSFDTPAIPGTHFTSVESSFPVTFEPSDQYKTIIINILNTAITKPVVFFVNIEVSTPHRVQNPQARVVVYPRGSLSSLYGLYFDVLIAQTLDELEEITSELLILLQEDQLSGRNAQESNTARYIINAAVDQASAINSNSTAVSATRRKRYTDRLKNNFLDIFEEIISNDTFSEMSSFVRSLQSFAYSLLEGRECPYNTTESRSSYYLESLRLREANLYGRRFSAEEGGDVDYLEYPSGSVFKTEPTTECLDVHYIEFFEERLFQSPTLRSKVLSTGIRGFSLPTIQNPITYRIYTSSDVAPTMDDFCMLWQYPSSESGRGSWITESSDGDQICNAKTSLVLQQDYIECECDMLGDFSASEEVVDLGYGWTLPAPLSCAFVMLAMFLVITLHFAYFRRTQLVTRIFIMFCISVFFFQLMGFINTLAASNASTDGCTALGIALHLTMIAQFVWLLALTVALWANFMGFTDDREPLIFYIVVSWGIAIVVVIVTLILGNFPGELDVGDGELYGAVPDNGDICFMPELSAALLSSMLPVLIVVMAVVALLSHSCVYWSRWEDYHNFYHDSFNKTEIPLLLVFFALVFLSWLLGGVHMYIREPYTFGIFVAFNVIEGIYALVVYFFVSWHTLTRKHKKYGVRDEVEPLTVPGEPDYLGSISTLASSRQQLIPEDEWEEDDDNVPPVVSLGMKRVSSEPSVQPSNQSGDSHLDDLMFMLKTQTYPHDEEEEEPDFPDLDSPRKPSASEHLELRRISIADTHL